jgi:DNA repair exonuclease SbcCD nuclease subunit
MKVAIITDQHFGVRKSDKNFHEFFKKFYDDVFFPTLEKGGITHVIDMGDTFDNRKSIDLWALKWAKQNYYDRLKDLGIEVHTIVGNHTAYYKNTNSVNTVDLLMSEYDNVTVYSEIAEVNIGGLDLLFVPWINSENQETSFETIKNSKCKIVMGHLELNGFKPYKGFVMEEGMDGKIFEKFTRVFSGHYHTRSNDGKIFYLGNPYQIYWNDVNDSRGFHIFDTKTLDLEVVENPYEIFKIVEYSDTPHQFFKYNECFNKYIKLVIKKKTNSTQFDKFFEKISDANPIELKVIDEVEIEEQPIEIFESEGTVAILDKYIDNAEIDLNKSSLKKLMQSVYKKASEIE